MPSRIAVSLTVLLIVATPLAAQEPGPWMHGYDWNWGHMLFGSLMMVLFWGGLIAAIVLFARHLGGHGGARRADALDILRERFARGEIDCAEFDERRHALNE